MSASAQAVRLAEENDVAYRFLIGSGSGGTIAAGDVEGYIAEVSGLRATPTARRLAALRQVDLRNVAGSGADGRIVRADVEAAGPSTPDGHLEHVRITPLRRRHRVQRHTEGKESQ